MVYIVKNPKTGVIHKVCANRTKARWVKRVVQKKIGVMLIIEEWKVW